MRIIVGYKTAALAKLKNWQSRLTRPSAQPYFPQGRRDCLKTLLGITGTALFGLVLGCKTKTEPGEKSGPTPPLKKSRKNELDQLLRIGEKNGWDKSTIGLVINEAESFCKKNGIAFKLNYESIPGPTPFKTVFVKSAPTLNEFAGFIINLGYDIKQIKDLIPAILQHEFRHAAFGQQIIENPPFQVVEFRGGQYHLIAAKFLAAKLISYIRSTSDPQTTEKLVWDLARAIDTNLDNGFGILTHYAEEVGVWALATPAEKNSRLLENYFKVSEALSKGTNNNKDQIEIAALAVIRDRLQIEILDPKINRRIESIKTIGGFAKAYCFFSDYFDFAVQNLPRPN